MVPRPQVSGSERLSFDPGRIMWWACPNQPAGFTLNKTQHAQESTHAVDKQTADARGCTCLSKAVLISRTNRLAKHEGHFSLPGCSVLSFCLCFCTFLSWLPRWPLPLRGAEPGVREIGLTYFLVVRGGGPKGGDLEHPLLPVALLLQNQQKPLSFSVFCDLH